MCRSVGAGAAVAMDQYASGETRRLQEAVSDAQRACSRAYIDELFVGVTTEIERAIQSADSQSVSRTVRDRTERLLEAFRQQLDSQAGIYRANLTSAMSGINNDWSKRTYLTGWSRGGLAGFIRIRPVDDVEMNTKNVQGDPENCTKFNAR